MIVYPNSDISTVAYGVIVHGVNCQGVMGSGLAKVLYEKWPEVKSDYLSLKEHVLGLIQFVPVTENITIVNCHTQEYYGREYKVYADIDAVANCMINVMINQHTTIHIPKIGCGLGGLNWVDVKTELLKIEQVFNREFHLHITGEKE